ncbi:hypothetical protein BSKO_10302 [Bryopsis sp. KO-2023]|nr:hypothetical protein BSKO_10302 [Bryopsis sp. KO-2023]
MRHLAAKAWYFFYFGSRSFIHPYLNLYFRRLGLNERAVGVLAGVKPWVSGPSRYLWATFADKHRKHKLVLIGTLVVSVVCKTLIGASHAYWLLMVLVFIGEFFGAPNGTIADAAVLASCKQWLVWKATSVGCGRLGINSFTMGALISRFGIEAPFVGFPIFSIFAIIAGFTLDMSLLTSPDDAQQGEEKKLSPDGLSDQNVPLLVESMDNSGMQDMHASASDAENIGEDALDGGKGSSKGRSNNSENAVACSAKNGGDGNAGFFSKLRKVLSDPEVIIFLSMTFLMGIASGAIESFLFLYLDQLGAPEYLMGLALLVTCSAEVPVFALMDRILRYVGVQTMLHIVMGVFILRLLGYVMLAALPSTWWVLAIEPLHGVTFGCAWGAGTEFSRRIAPPGLDATLQAIFSGMYFGIGYGTGAVVGGALFNEFGPRIMYACVAMAVAVGWGMCLIAIRVLHGFRA